MRARLIVLKEAVFEPTSVNPALFKRPRWLTTSGKLYLAASTPSKPPSYQHFGRSVGLLCEQRQPIATGQPWPDHGIALGPEAWGD